MSPVLRDCHLRDNYHVTLRALAIMTRYRNRGALLKEHKAVEQLRRKQETERSRKWQNKLCVDIDVFRSRTLGIKVNRGLKEADNVFIVSSKRLFVGWHYVWCKGNGGQWYAFRSANLKLEKNWCCIIFMYPLITQKYVIKFAIFVYKLCGISESFVLLLFIQ